MSRNYFYSPPSYINGRASNLKDYGLFKGRLQFVAPFNNKYSGAPHYILRMEANGTVFNVAVNSASSVPSENGDERVLMVVSRNFKHTILTTLDALSEGIHRGGFTRLDYLRTPGLVDLADIAPIPDLSEDGSTYDVNDDYNSILGIGVSQGGREQDYFNGATHTPRIFYPNLDKDVVVYTFGFIYPTNDGLHETHMNQGNPIGEHDHENGVAQDGAVIIRKAGIYTAFFTAFETQQVPTDDCTGYPLDNSKPLIKKMV